MRENTITLCSRNRPPTIVSYAGRRTRTTFQDEAPQHVLISPSSNNAPDSAARRPTLVIPITIRISRSGFEIFLPQRMRRRRYDQDHLEPLARFGNVQPEYLSPKIVAAFGLETVRRPRHLPAKERVQGYDLI